MRTVPDGQSDISIRDSSDLGGIRISIVTDHKVEFQFLNCQGAEIFRDRIVIAAGCTPVDGIVVL